MLHALSERQGCPRLPVDEQTNREDAMTTGDYGNIDWTARARMLRPDDISPAIFDEYREWFERSSSADEKEWVMVETMGSELLGTDLLRDLLGLYLSPEYFFDEPMQTRSMGVVDPFMLNVRLFEDGLHWLEIDVLEMFVEAREGWSSEAVDRVRADLLKLVEYGLVHIRNVDREDGDRGKIFFRLRWPVILKRWRASRERWRHSFRPDGYIYLLGAPGFYKIGRAKRPDDRVKQLKIQLSWEVEVEHLIPCENYVAAERVLHERFADQRANGEWFALSDSDVSLLKSIARMRGPDIEFGGPS